jgi:hypothetical protein
MPGAAGSGAMKLIPVIIILIAIFLAYYAVTMQKKGVLR